MLSRRNKSKKVELRGRPKGSSNVATRGSNQSTLGSYLASARVNAGLGLADVADAIGVSVAFVSNVEFGRAPMPYKYLDIIASLLNVNLDKLYELRLFASKSYKDFYFGPETNGNDEQSSVA